MKAVMALLTGSLLLTEVGFCFGSQRIEAIHEQKGTKL